MAMPTENPKKLLVANNFREEFVAVMKTLMAQAHDTAVDCGWYEKEINIGEHIALTHSELSEALDAMRHGNPPSKKIPEFTSAEEELADVVIHVMDFCEHHNMDLPGAILRKMQFNAERPYHHGGKLF